MISTLVSFTMSIQFMYCLYINNVTALNLIIINTDNGGPLEDYMKDTNNHTNSFIYINDEYDEFHEKLSKTHSGTESEVKKELMEQIVKALHNLSAEFQTMKLEQSKIRHQLDTMKMEQSQTTHQLDTVKEDQLQTTHQLDIMKVEQFQIRQHLDTMESELEHYYPDCYELLLAGHNKSGIYMIRTGENIQPFPVYCEQDVAGGGWTVFQKRSDEHVDFFRNWTDYKWGFGELTNNFWLGLEKIYSMTRRKTYTLRIDLGDFEGSSTYAIYNHFAIASEDDFYRMISIGSYAGNAGDSLYYHVGQPFSTKDKLNIIVDCPNRHEGAWWYKSCYTANLNGHYFQGGASDDWKGICWSEGRRNFYSYKKTSLMIKPTMTA